MTPKANTVQSDQVLSGTKTTATNGTTEPSEQTPENQNGALYHGELQTENSDSLVVLVPPTASISLGTTVLSRTADPVAVVSAETNVVANRPVDTSVDSDHDGIADYDEVNIYGTDPKKADTNDDGILDGASVLKGIDPIAKGRVEISHEDPRQVMVDARDSKGTILSVKSIAFDLSLLSFP